MPDALQAAIDAAAAELVAESKKATGKDPTPEVQEPEVEVEDSETPEAESESEETPSDDLTEAQQIEARNLYKALSGPQAGPVVAALAAQLGLLPRVGEAPLTRKEEVSARREIEEVVEEALGPEYKFLAPKLGQIFKTVLEQQEEQTEARIAEVRQTQIENQVTTAYQELATETKGLSKQYEDRMAELSGEIPPGNMSIKTYMKRLYTIAAAERKPLPTGTPQKVADRVRQNANDIPNRVRSSAGPQPVPGKVPDKKMNLNEAVNWAIGELQKGKR